MPLKIWRWGDDTELQEITDEKGFTIGAVDYDAELKQRHLFSDNKRTSIAVCGVRRHTAEYPTRDTPWCDVCKQAFVRRLMEN